MPADETKDEEISNLSIISGVLVSVRVDCANCGAHFNYHPPNPEGDDDTVREEAGPAAYAAGWRTDREDDSSALCPGCVAARAHADALDAEDTSAKRGEKALRYHCAELCGLVISPHEEELTEL